MPGDDRVVPGFVAVIVTFRYINTYSDYRVLRVGKEGLYTSGVRTYIILSSDSSGQHRPPRGVGWGWVLWGEGGRGV